jgi:hypothetical protein
VLDGREHGGIITAEGRRVPQVRAVYTRVFTAANTASDEDMAQADNGNNEGVGGGNGDSEDDSGGAGP